MSAHATALSGRLLAAGSLLLAALAFAPPARADDPPASAAADPATGLPTPETIAAARALLREKAVYWASKYRQDLALEVYRRLLDTAPNDPAALAGAAQMALAVYNPYAADDYLARLRAVAPDDPALAKLQRIRNRTPEYDAALANARLLASTKGKTDEAVAAYRKLMPGNVVPDEMAAEFYPLLIASLPDQSVDANDALTAFGAVAAKAPNDDNLQLAYARAMIVQEGTRADGFEKLRALAKNSSVASEARRDWRTALLWQGADFAAQAQLETYLKENPSDPELDAKREEFRASLPSEGAWDRIHAYEAMRANQMGEAEKQFQAALAFDPKDVDAMIMIAAIRVQQGKRADAHTLTEQAVALAPDRRQELLAIVGEDPEGNARAAATAAHAVAGQYEEVDRLAKQGNYDQAEAKMRHLMGGKPNAGDLQHLGDIQTRAGHLDQAAATLRKALDIAPGNADAAVALAAVLTRQGRTQDAADLYTRAEADFTKSGNRAGLQALRQGRAAELHAKADATHDPAAQLALLRSAVDIDPSDPWLRLALAHALRKTGATAEAQEVMVVITPDSVAPAKPAKINQAVKLASAKRGAGASSADAALQAGFIWADERGDLKQAAAFADRVPAAARTPEMVDAQTRAALADEIRQAMNKQDAAGNRKRLVALASRSDPDGKRNSQIARAALHAGDKEGAERIIYAGLDNTNGPTPQQRLRYAGVLLEADAPTLAAQLIDGIKPEQLPADQRRALPQMLDDLASAKADDLTKTGKLDEAYKILAPRLAENPNSNRLNLSLSRWQVASGHAGKALKVTETMAQRDPTDLDARHAAIEAAVADGDLRVAETLLADAMKRFPVDPYLLMQAANIAWASDKKGEALEFMRRARHARAGQLAAADSDP